MPPSPPPQGTSVRVIVAMAISLFATLWLAGWSHAATISFESPTPASSFAARALAP